MFDVMAKLWDVHVLAQLSDVQGVTIASNISTDLSKAVVLVKSFRLEGIATHTRVIRV